MPGGGIPGGRPVSAPGSAASSQTTTLPGATSTTQAEALLYDLRAVLWEANEYEMWDEIEDEIADAFGKATVPPTDCE